LKKLFDREAKKGMDECKRSKGVLPAAGGKRITEKKQPEKV